MCIILLFIIKQIKLFLYVNLLTELSLNNERVTHGTHSWHRTSRQLAERCWSESYIEPTLVPTVGICRCVKVGRTLVLWYI